MKIEQYHLSPTIGWSREKDIRIDAEAAITINN